MSPYHAAQYYGVALLTSAFWSLVSASDIVTVDWAIPLSGGSLPSKEAKVGDTAVFEWGGFHNVLIHPTGDCSEDNAIDVGSVSGASYTFTESDIGEVVFACDVGRHCEFGQIITFEVSAPDKEDEEDVQVNDEEDEEDKEEEVEEEVEEIKEEEVEEEVEEIKEEEVEEEVEEIKEEEVEEEVEEIKEEEVEEEVEEIKEEEVEEEVEEDKEEEVEEAKEEEEEVENENSSSHTTSLVLTSVLLGLVPLLL